MYRQKAMDYLHKIAERYDLDIEWEAYEECGGYEGVHFAVEGVGEEMRLAGYREGDIRTVMWRIEDIKEGFDESSEEEEEEDEEEKREKKRPAIFAE